MSRKKVPGLVWSWLHSGGSGLESGICFCIWWSDYNTHSLSYERSELSRAGAREAFLGVAAEFGVICSCFVSMQKRSRD